MPQLCHSSLSSCCADVFILYFLHKTHRICSGSSSYSIGPLLGARVSLKTFLAVVMIFSNRECSSRFSKRQPDTARVGIRRAVLITRALLPSAS
jgi:hypothetical protein